LIVADDLTANLLRRTAQGTLESVFRALTRKEQADDAARGFLDALDGKPASGQSPKQTSTTQKNGRRRS
jgi:hypothetical protein